METGNAFYEISDALNEYFRSSSNDRNSSASYYLLVNRILKQIQYNQPNFSNFEKLKLYTQIIEMARQDMEELLRKMENETVS